MTGGIRTGGHEYIQQRTHKYAKHDRLKDDLRANEQMALELSETLYKSVIWGLLWTNLCSILYEVID